MQERGGDFFTPLVRVVEKTREVRENRENFFYFKMAYSNSVPSSGVPELKCPVCNKPVGTVHKCLECKAYVHIFCGTYDKNDEGFGQSSICFNCERQPSSPPSSSSSDQLQVQHTTTPATTPSPGASLLLSSLTSSVSLGSSTSVKVLHRKGKNKYFYFVFVFLFSLLAFIYDFLFIINNHFGELKILSIKI